MPKELFKTIVAYPNYEVSSLGRVRNKKKGNIIKWVDNGKGYKVVKIYSSTKPKGRLCLVHRLVMSTFKPINYQMDVNHIDGNKSNNNLDNLEWISKSDNTRHAHLTGLFSSRNKLTIEDVKEIKRLVKDINRDTYDNIGKKYGVNGSIVSKIALGYLYNYV